MKNAKNALQPIIVDNSKSTAVARDGYLKIGEFHFLAIAEFRFGKSRPRCIKAEHVDDDAPYQGKDFRRVVVLDYVVILSEMNIGGPSKNLESVTI